MDSKEVKDLDTAVKFLKAHHVKWQFVAIAVIVVILIGYDIVKGIGAGA